MDIKILKIRLQETIDKSDLCIKDSDGSLDFDETKCEKENLLNAILAEIEILKTDQDADDEFNARFRD